MTTDHLAADLIGRFFDPAEPSGSRVLRTAIRLLADGKPVTLAQLAEATGTPVDGLDGTPSWQDVEFDDHGRIVGWGLTLNPTPHSFVVGGRQLYAWCAGDTLIFPGLIGRAAEIASPCPATDKPIRLTVDPWAGIGGLDPSTAVIAIPDIEQVRSVHIRTDLCDPQRFFADVEATREWQHRHSGGTVLPVADAYYQVFGPLSEHIANA